MTAKKFLQNKYPSMKKHWNEHDVIDDNWVAEMMEAYAEQQIKELVEAIKSMVHLDDDICKCPICKIGKQALNQ